MTPRPMLVTVSAWISRIIMAFVQIASIRVLIKGLGVEQFTIFALLSALMGWFMLADMGIGLSLQNHISTRRSKFENYSVDITTTIAIAGLLFAFIVLVLGILSPYIAPIYLKQFQEINNVEKTKLFFLSGFVFIATAFGGIGYKIWYAEQKGYLANIFPAIASLIGYLGIVFINYSSLNHKLYYSILVFLAPPAVISLWALISVFIKRLGPGWAGLPGLTLVGIFKRSINFWLLLVITSLSLQIDYLVMSQFLDSNNIFIYNLSTRISWFILALYTSALTVIWPIFSESIARGNWAMVNKITKKYLTTGLGLSFIISSLLIWLMPVFVRFLAPRENIEIPVMFIVLLGVYQLIRVWTDTFIMILQSMGDLKPLWMSVPFQALLSIIFQWYLVQLIGLYGIILGNVLSFGLTSAWFLPRAVIRHYRRQAVRPT